MGLPELSADPLVELSHALRRTCSNPAAQISVEWTASLNDMTGPSEREGGLVAATLRRVASRTWTSRGEGAIAFEPARAMVRYGDRSMLVVGDRVWQGDSRDVVADLKSARAPAHQALWIFDLARGLVDAEQDGSEQVGEQECLRYGGHADLSQVAEAVAYRIALPFPAYEWVDQLRSFPIELWVDHAGLLRRSRAAIPGGLFTIELVAFGSAEALDWSRLP